MSKQQAITEAELLAATQDHMQAAGDDSEDLSEEQILSVAGGGTAVDGIRDVLASLPKFTESSSCPARTSGYTPGCP